MFLADMPLVPADAAGRLLAALESGAAGAECVADGAPAHPVAFAASLFDDLAALRGDEGGRRLLAGRADVARIAVASLGATFDVDRREDLARGAG